MGIPHILWDYHALGGHKAMDKLDAKLWKYVDKMEFFHKAGPTVTKTQTGGVRTNCTDCLDRTNSVQMYLGLKLLPSQLAMMGLNEKDSIVSRLEHLCTSITYKNR